MLTITGDSLNVFDVHSVANAHLPIELSGPQMTMVSRTFERVQRWGHLQEPIYGVNTGFGELAHIAIPATYKSELQENLLRSHAAGGGPIFEEEIVRAMMVVRLNCLMKGHSGISPQAAQLFCTFLNRGIHPVVPEQGSLGASGDLAPLAHLALPFIGEGEVTFRGVRRASAEVLAGEEIIPLTLGFKEALALINGTSAMTAAACIAIVNAYRLLQLAVVLSADVVQALQASTRPFEAVGHQLKNHLGQIAVAQVLANLITGSQLTREHEAVMKAISDKVGQAKEVTDAGIQLQNAYTLRCIPQILGPVLDNLAYCRRLVEEEVNSCNDNPLFFDTPQDTFHGGNFHGQYVAMASDLLNISIAEIGVLAERQLNRLVDPHLNGVLPPFLACGDAGLHCGYEGAQYLATSIASENLDLAAPASIKSLPSNGENQDVVSMGLIAARKSLRLCRNVKTILAVLGGACYQASLMFDSKTFSPHLQKFHALLSSSIEEYKDKVVMAKVIESIQRVIGGDAVCQYLDNDVALSAGHSFELGSQAMRRLAAN